MHKIIICFIFTNKLILLLVRLRKILTKLSKWRNWGGGAGALTL